MDAKEESVEPRNACATRVAWNAWRIIVHVQNVRILKTYNLSFPHCFCCYFNLNISYMLLNDQLI